MPSLHRFVTFALLCLAGLLLPTTARADDGPSFTESVKTFRKALRSKTPDERARAFDYLRSARDPKVVDQVTYGLKRVEREERLIRKGQESIEKSFEKSFEDLEDAKLTFEMSSRSERDMKRFNKKARKITKDLDEATLRIKNLENDFMRNRALLHQAVLVMGAVLASMEGETLTATLDGLAEAWLADDDIRWKIRWARAMRAALQPEATKRLRTVAADTGQPDQVRVVALDALVARDDGWVLGQAIENLKLGIEHTQIIKASIKALRDLHDRRGIEPLIDFLNREDLKVERNVAHQALASLTAVDHGLYPGQWKKWWEEVGADFEMPKDPKPPGNTAPPKEGTTFYGIQTFSDRILYIVDISGSMDKPMKGPGAKGRTKMQVCKQELIGSVYNLNPTDTFNVIFFNHQVIPWQTSKIEANDSHKKMLDEWVTEQKPLGATNIHDALELGFNIAHRVNGPPQIDTIFFLTDGNPTAGKVRDSELILELVRGWNETARLTIHAVGIGSEHDADFLKELARIGDGQYVRR